MLMKIERRSAGSRSRRGPDSLLARLPEPSLTGIVAPRCNPREGHPMCKGDDVNCPQFEAHYRSFKEDLNVERRSFLKSGFLAAGGLAALGAGGGMSLVTPALAQASAA